MGKFEKATRKKSKVRLALIGASGSGKTLSALLLAYGITKDWNKVALIDTEHERGRFYADRKEYNIGEFLYAVLDQPYSPERYVEYVQEAAQEVGSDGVVIIDSFSHAWDNEGGVKEIKGQIEARMRSNNAGFSAWDEAGKIQNRLINNILSVDCHTILTMRTKTEYAMQTDERGKVKPVKIGLAPVQREKTEYEFDIALYIDENHVASVNKDTTFLESAGWSGVITPELGEQLGAWLNEGTEPARCELCGTLIRRTAKRSVEELTTASKEKFGHVFCAACARKVLEESKKVENESEVNTDE